MKEAIKNETINYLEGYLANKKLIKMMHYEKEYFREDYEESKNDYLSLPCNDEVLLRASMFDVRKFIMNIGDSNCKMLLYYHYIKGQPIAKCAELMGISRTSAFRLRKKALELAERKYTDIKNTRKLKILSNLAG